MIGKHLLAEYWKCNQDTLRDISKLEQVLRDAAEQAGFTVLQGMFQELDDGINCGVLLLKESHLSIHANPQEGYVAVDIYTMSKGSPEKVHSRLRRGLGSRRTEILSVKRGTDKGMNTSSTSWSATGSWTPFTMEDLAQVG